MPSPLQRGRRSAGRESRAQVETRQRLAFFYRHIAKRPDQIGQIDGWLAKHTGRERELVKKVNKTYKAANMWVPQLVDCVALGPDGSPGVGDVTTPADDGVSVTAVTPLRPSAPSAYRVLGGAAASAAAARSAASGRGGAGAAKTLDLGDYVARLAASSLDRTPAPAARAAAAGAAAGPASAFALSIESKEDAAPQGGGSVGAGSSSSNSSSELNQARQEFRAAFDELVHLHSRSAHPRAKGANVTDLVHATPFRKRTAIDRTPPQARPGA